MSRMRQGYLLRGVAILIAAVFSGAWTFTVAGMGGVPAVTASADDTPALPDGSSVPTEAIDAPASVSDPTDLTSGNSASIVAASSTNAIPSAALAAYQRAETVINQADESCNITWQLLAAIGRVESNHGRVNGNVLDGDGVSTPGIFGPALNGQGNVKAIRDTDGGQFDADAKWDRAVGPMQFIPSTWSVVGVDADDDGQRNPQDIDDAALAAAVYLCSGDDDLSTLAGQKSAIFRYNNSTSYVNLVLDIMEAYLAGNYTSVSGTTTAGGYIVPDPTYNPPPAYNPPKGKDTGFQFGQGSNSGSTSGSGGSSGGGGGDTSSPDDSDGGTPTVTDPRTDEEVDPGVTSGDGPLNPDDNNVPDTGSDEVDEPLENTVDGLLGPLKSVEVTIKCEAYAINQADSQYNPLVELSKWREAKKDAKAECVASYS